MRCEFERDVSIYLRGALPASEHARFVAHLVDCGSCAAFVASDQRHFGANPDRPPRREVPATESPAPSRVGRYIVLNLVGRGGMGDVYAAYDPRLDRKVALKLLRETRGDGPTVAAAQERLLREAQATARLSHHNVVVVYDAGTFEQDGGGSRVYLAMELVQGRTLSAWLAEERRSWRQIRDLFLAAGEGLQAAHEAGLVHRDFKPQNVMVGRDGGVRVMDFGLAGDASEMPAGDRTALDATSEGSPTAETVALTHTGVLLGTPVYMAPEQFTGRPTDARTDQFSFCVALYEALYGERPFPSETYTALVGAVIAGRVREAPEGGRVPGFLRKVLLRGLRAEPDARYPSMRELLSALGADPIRYRRGVATGAAVTALTLAVMVGTHALAARKQRMCRAGTDKLEGIWEADGTGPRRAAVHASFVASGSAIAEDTWNRASALLDDYSQRWTAAYTDTCEATHVRGDQSGEVLDLRMTCLDRERGAVRALTDVFMRADTRTVIEAVNGVNALPPIEQCADVPQLRAVVPRPTDPAARARVADVEAKLAEVTALTDTGSWQSAYSKAKPLVGEARKAGYEPLLADVLGAHGWLGVELGDVKMATRSYEEATAVALAAHQDDLAARAAAQMLWLTLSDSREESDQWTALAGALTQRLGWSHERTVAWFHQNRALALARQGRLQDCATESSLALSLKREVLAPNHPDIAISLAIVAGVRAEMGDGASALAAAQEALDIYGRAYGYQNPNLWMMLDYRGRAFRALHRYEEAENDLRSAVAFVRALAGADHLFTADPLQELARVLIDEGKCHEAEQLLTSAIRVLERSDPTSPDLQECRFGLARARWEMDEGRPAALAMARAALTTYRAGYGLRTRIDEMQAWLTDKPPARSGGGRVLARTAKRRNGTVE